MQREQPYNIVRLKIIQRFLILNMYYPLFGATVGVGLYYARQYYKSKTAIAMTPEVPNHTFFKGTIGSHIELRKQQNKYVLYSHLHHCPLSIHELITKSQVAKQGIMMNSNDASQFNNNSQNIIKNQASQKQYVGVMTTTNKSIVITIPAQSKSGSVNSEIEQNQIEGNKNQGLFRKIFHDYAAELINNRTCQQVQLIYGPIYPKDTPYKPFKENGTENENEQKEDFTNIFKSNIKLNSRGDYLTDKFYTIVICNGKQKRHLNGFTMRKSGYKNFKLLNYLTSVAQIQQKTGLTFNVEGDPLTFIDYNGINKQKLFSDYESPKQREGKS